MLTTLQLAGRDWLIPAILLYLLALVVVYLAYRGLKHLSPRLRLLCLGLKTLGFFLLALCLLEPEYVKKSTEEQLEEGVYQVALLYDNSLGLTITDSKQKQSRGEQMRTSVTDAAFRDELGESFDLREYLVDKRLRRGGPADLDFTGNASELSRAIASLARRAKGQLATIEAANTSAQDPGASNAKDTEASDALQAIVLFTDGNGTDRELATLDPSTLPPIYPVVLGSDKPRADVALGRVETTQSAFEEAPIRLRADIVAHGARGQQVAAVLYDEAGAEVGRETVVISKDSEQIPVRFTHRPLNPGPAFYRMVLGSEIEHDIDGNNERHIAVHRDVGPYRILYVSGRPNWEFKFLHRAVAPDREIELVGLIRIAKREPKFAFRGRAGEASNPLFRGFNNADEEDGFDQPVMQRIYTKDEEELAGGFPKSKEELFAYDALILDDVEAAFFSQDQMDLVDDFVAKRGGGLLMLGGQECFTHGKYEKTPFADLLPVYVEGRFEADGPSGTSHQGDAPAARPDARDLRLDFTREGWLQPWVRLRETEDAERERLATMTPFATLNRIGAIKPGASVLASVTVTDTAANPSKQPALIAHRYGNGRAAALLIGDLWRWGFKQPDQRPDMEKAWRQTVRWLVADVPRRVSLGAKREPGTITLNADILDETFQPATEADTALRVTDPTGQALELEALPSDAQAGRFEVSYKPVGAGCYKADVMVLDEKGEELGSSATGWALNPAAEELRSIVPDRTWLADLAASTGGEVLTLDQLDQLPKLIQHPKVTVEVTKVVSLWHLPIVFFGALLCFVLEWWLRREKGLA